ncbi:glycosyltransferase [Candidatus Pacearchaeota archaeon]|jgi:hypothetical protein|nr:glycosyltransferase [Candidatus Pacearchaeota archaeon]
MSIMLATLVLNEMEHLPNLYEQHKDWPKMNQWVFVESADRYYAKANPTMVTEAGLSVDGTSQFLKELSEKDPRVIYIPFGFSSNKDPAQGKVESRQQYLKVANESRPDFLFILDADEFYTCADQDQITKLMGNSSRNATGFRFKHRYPWRPGSIRDWSLFGLEVVGAYWDIPHIRGWRYFPGLTYASNHNWPEANGKLLSKAVIRYDSMPGNHPECAHLAFASINKIRAAKHRYYIARGEGLNDGRQMYVDCRAAFETWKPGKKLPHGASIIKYTGPIPEVLQQDSEAITWCI